jgi:hypothetical protein
VRVTQNLFVSRLTYHTSILHLSASVSPQDVARTQDIARSLNTSRNSRSSEVSPLKDGALLEPGPGIALIPLIADMASEGADETGFLEDWLSRRVGN